MDTERALWVHTAKQTRVDINGDDVTKSCLILEGFLVILASSFTEEYLSCFSRIIIFLVGFTTKIIIVWFLF